MKSKLREILPNAAFGNSNCWHVEQGNKLVFCCTLQDSQTNSFIDIDTNVLFLSYQPKADRQEPATSYGDKDGETMQKPRNQGLNWRLFMCRTSLVRITTSPGIGCVCMSVWIYRYITHHRSHQYVFQPH